jgi:uncharacterized protein YkwD
MLLPLLGGCYVPGAEVLEERDGLAEESAKCLVPEDESRLADQVLQLVNLERAAAGLPPLVTNPVLQKIAEAYACRMIDEGFFDHRDASSGDGPSERAVAHDYSFYAIGENLAAGQESAAEVMRVWMESPSHREIILDSNWEEIGIGVRLGGEYSVYWVQEFGQPAGS